MTTPYIAERPRKVVTGPYDLTTLVEYDGTVLVLHARLFCLVDREIKRCFSEPQLGHFVHLIILQYDYNP
jgi:hypothetical protein